MSTPAFRRALCIIALLAAPSGARLDAAAGDLDCTFDGDGRVSANFSSIEAAHDIEVLADGSIVTLGTDMITPGSNLRLTRFLPDGALDASFGGSGSILHTFTGFTFGGADFVSPSVRFDRDSAGRFLVVGSAILTSGQIGDREVWVGRFTPAGAIDTSFGGGDGWVSFDWSAASDGSTAALDNAYDIAVDASDRPVVGGTLDLNGPIFSPSDSDFGIARLTIAGVLDTAFDGDGIALVTSGVIDDELHALKIDPSGRIVAAGARRPQHFARDSLIVRLTATGALDASFDGDGIRILDLTQTGSTAIEGEDLIVDLDFAPGTPAPIVVTGPSLNTPTVARFLDSGSVDTSFGGGDGIVHVQFEAGAQDVVDHVMVQPDGKILVTGSPAPPGTNFDFSAMRLETDGDLDPTWSGDGRQTFDILHGDRAYAAALMADGRVVLAGSSVFDATMAIARLLGDASPIASTVTSILGDAPDPSSVGQIFSVGLQVHATSGSAAPSGSVTVGDGVDSTSCALFPGAGPTSTAACLLALTSLGERSLVATYAGNGVQFCGSSSLTEPHQVNLPPPAPTTTTITSDDPDPSVVGLPVTVAYNVTATAGTPSGDVSVQATGGSESCTATVAAGQCSMTLTTGGFRNFVATYAGNTSFEASSSDFTGHQVTPGLTTTTITAVTPSPSVLETGVTVAWTIAVLPPALAIPGGDVTVTISGGTETCSAPASFGSCSLWLSAVGNRTFTASYAGDASTVASSDTESHEVVRGASTTTIVSHLPAPSVTGQSISVAFEVTASAAPPFGTVTVTDGRGGSCTGPVVPGPSSCSFAPSAAGALVLTASYSGNEQIAPSTATATHTVAPAPTALALQGIAPEPSAPGQAAAVAFAVSVPAPGAGTPTGTVTVSSGALSCTAPVADGVCNLTWTSGGTYPVTASYSGDSNFAPSQTTAALSHGVTGEGAAEIPTLGEWGLIGLGLGISFAARRALRRGGASRKASRLQH